MDQKTVATLVVTIALAVIGFFAAYLNSLRIALRKDRLDRVNRQLSELYGPLFALNAAANRAWVAFRSKYRPNVASFWHDQDPPTPDEAAGWRLWMTEVFTPLNKKMVEVIVGNADLLDEETMPSCLTELCAHVAAYSAVVRRWEAGDFAENVSTVNFPRDDLSEYVSVAYRRLKAHQRHLLGFSKAGPTA